MSLLEGPSSTPKYRRRDLQRKVSGQMSYDNHKAVDQPRGRKNKSKKVRNPALDKFKYHNYSGQGSHSVPGTPKTKRRELATENHAFSIFDDDVFKSHTVNHGKNSKKSVKSNREQDNDLSSFFLSGHSSNNDKDDKEIKPIRRKIKKKERVQSEREESESEEEEEESEEEESGDESEQQSEQEDESEEEEDEDDVAHDADPDDIKDSEHQTPKKRRVTIVYEEHCEDHALKQKTHSENKKGEKICIMEVMCVLKSGTPFLKYGRFGFPHFRHVKISRDNTTLIWYSKAKHLSKTRITLADVQDISLGITTQTFNKHSAPQKLKKCAFSIHYRNGQKTLDLIAKDMSEYRIWVAGLKKLVEINKRSISEAKALKDLELPIAIFKGTKVVTNGIDFIAQYNERRKKRRPSAGPKERHQIHRSLKSLQKRQAKVHKRVSKVVGKEEYDTMIGMLDKVDESCETIGSWFSEGDYGACSHEIWRAGVNLEALNNMISSVLRSN